MLGHIDLCRQGAAAESSQVDANDAVLAHVEVPRHARGGIQLDPMALTVIERKRVTREALANRNAKRGGGIESSAEEADSFQEV